VYSGVTTIELARLLRSVVLPRDDLVGLLHVASTPIAKYELLRLIAREYQWSGRIVPSDDVVCDRSLSADAFFSLTGYRSPQWTDMIAEMRRCASRWRPSGADPRTGHRK
jgi:dTDP-4-dehydrorhamnose reductase